MSMMHHTRCEVLCKVSLGWKGLGGYIEDTEDGSVVVSNYPGLPSFVLNDFMLLIAAPPEGVSDGTWRFLVCRAKLRLNSKTLTMNCWQFVLLCMVQSGFLSFLDVSRLYQLCTMSHVRIPERMCSDERHDSVVEGDILFFWNIKHVCWHMGISVSDNRYIHCLGENVALSTLGKNDHYFAMSALNVQRAILGYISHQGISFRAPVMDTEDLKIALCGALSHEIEEQEQLLWGKECFGKDPQFFIDVLDDDYRSLMRDYNKSKFEEAAMQVYRRTFLKQHKEEVIDLVFEHHGIY
jgi:hypothetical protein